jgi:hypothetical protein
MNTTDTAFPSTVERTALVIWSLLVSLVSVTGNLVVLIASLKYRAIHLDKVSLVLIQHLCVTDMCTVAYILLTVGNIARGEFLYGDFLCYWSYAFGLSLVAVEMGLICGLNVSKLFNLLSPLGTRQRTTRTGWVIAVTVWILAFGWSLSVRLYSYLKGEVIAYFSPSNFQCLALLHTSQAGIFARVYGLLYFVLPILVLLVSTAWLFFYVKIASGINKHTVLTLTLVSGVFLLACGPISAAIFLSYSHHQSSWYRIYFRFASFIAYLNYAANPIIYFLTLKSFREFVQTKMRDWFPNFL